MAATGNTSGTTLDQVACFCCGQLFNAGDITRFDQHPDQGVCARCAEWLHNRSHPGSRKARRPVWRQIGRRRWRKD
jgi:hypothetical protein